MNYLQVCFWTPLTVLRSIQTRSGVNFGVGLFILGSIQIRLHFFVPIGSGLIILSSGLRGSNCACVLRSGLVIFGSILDRVLPASGDLVFFTPNYRLEVFMGPLCSYSLRPDPGPQLGLVQMGLDQV